MLSKYVGLLVVSAFASVVLTGSVGCNPKSSFPEPDTRKKTATDALDVQMKKSFDAWLAAPVKSCSAIEVVGGGGSADGANAIRKGIDLKILAQKTGASFSISASDGSQAVLLSSSPEPFAKVFDSSTLTLTGSANQKSLTVETEMDGFNCLVKVNGREAARVKLAAKVPVILAVSLLNRATDLEVDTTEFIRKVNDEVAVLNVKALVSQATIFLQDQATLEKRLAEYGYSDLDVRAYFPFSASAAQSDMTVSIGFEQFSAMAFADEAVVTQDLAKKLMAPAGADEKPIPGALRLAYRSSLPKELNGVITAPPAIAAIVRPFGLAKGTDHLVFKDGGAWNYLKERVSESSANLCTQQRLSEATALLNARGLETMTKLPSRESIVSICKILDPGLEARIRTNGYELSAFADLVGMSQKSVNKVAFGDWTAVVQARTEEALGTAATLVATNRTSVISQLLDAVKAIKDVENFNQIPMSHRNLLAILVVALLEDRRLATDTDNLKQAARVAGIASASEFVPALVSAYETFVQNPEVGRQQLAWAEAMKKEYIELALLVRKEALAHGYSDYAGNVHNKLFEKQLTEAELQAMMNKINSGLPL